MGGKIKSARKQQFCSAYLVVHFPGQPLSQDPLSQTGMGLSVVQAALEAVQLVHVPDVLNTHPALYWYGWQPEAVHGLMAQVLR